VRRKIDKVYHTIENLDESWPEPTIPDPTLRPISRFFARLRPLELALEFAEVLRSAGFSVP
jgi:hypothetical protein